MMDIFVLKRVCISTKARHDAIESGATEEEASKAYENAFGGTGIEFSSSTSIGHLTFNRELNDLLFSYFKKAEIYGATKTDAAHAEMKEAYDMFHTYRIMSTDTELLIFPMYQL